MIFYKLLKLIIGSLDANINLIDGLTVLMNKNYLDCKRST